MVLEKVLIIVDYIHVAGARIPERLIIQQSADKPPRWGWQNVSNVVDWQQEFANAMTSALEFLINQSQLHP